MADRSVVVRLRAEIGGYQAAMAQAAASTTRVGTAATRAAAEAAAAERNTSTTAGRMVQSATRNQQAWQQAGTTMTGFGVIVLGALGLSAKAAIDWETAWTGVLKTVDGSPQQIARLETELRGLAKALPVSHAEIAAVAEAAGQLGVKTKDVAGFTKVMLDLGQTTNLTSDEAATSIAQLMNVMQTAPEDVDNLGAALVDLGNNGASTERQIVQMAQRISGAGKIIGLTEAEVLGIANAVASVGIEVEAGGSAISRILIDMSKAVSTGGKDLDGFAKAAGMSSTAFVTAFKNDPAGAFASFTEGLGRIDAAGGDVFTTLADLGQSDIRVSRALLTMANSGSLLRDSIEMGNEAWAANTALLEEAEKRYATTESQLKSAKGSIVDAAITLGQQFLPMIAAAANGVGALADGFGSMPPVVQAVIGIVGLAAGSLGLLGGAFLLLAPRILATRVAFATLATDMPRAAAVARTTATALKGIGLTAVAVAAAAAATGMLVEALVGGAVVPKAEALQKAIRDIAKSGGDLGDVGGQFSGFGDVLGASVNNAKSLADAFDQMLKPSTTDRVSGFFDEFPGVTGYMERTQERVEGLDTALTAMISEGDIDAVNQFQAGLLEAGYTAEDINKLLPNTADALVGVKDTATDTAEAMVVMADGTTQSAEAFEEWRQKVIDASLTFVDPMGAYDAVIQANKDFAQSTADATEDAEDSWEDYYDGQSVNITQYLAELQSQLDAQAAYNSNLLALKETVSAQYFSFLEGLGQEGAPLIAALATATEEELDLADTLYIQGQNAGQQLANGLAEADLDVNTKPALTTLDGLKVKWDDTGKGRPPWVLAANPELAEQTVYDFSAEWDAAGTSRVPWYLKADPSQAQATTSSLATSIDWTGNARPAWMINANTNPALTSANSAVTTINAKTASIAVDANTSAAEAAVNRIKSIWGAATATVPLGMGIPGKATGGRITGPGTSTSDSILGIDAMTNMPTARVSVDEFVVNARSYRKHQRLVEAINADRLPGLAAGGVPQGASVQPAQSHGTPVVTVTPPSLEGMVLEGTLMVNGMEAQMHAVAVSAIDSRQGDLALRRNRGR